MIANLPFLPGEAVRTADAPQRPKAPAASKAEQFEADYARTAQKPRAPAGTADQKPATTETSPHRDDTGSENADLSPGTKPAATDDEQRVAATTISVPALPIPVSIADATSTPTTELVIEDAAQAEAPFAPVLEDTAIALDGTTAPADLTEGSLPVPKPAATPGPTLPPPDALATLDSASVSSSPVKEVAGAALPDQPLASIPSTLPAARFPDAAAVGVVKAAPPASPDKTKALVQPLQTTESRHETRSPGSPDPASVGDLPDVTDPQAPAGKEPALPPAMKPGIVPVAVQAGTAPQEEKAASADESEPISAEASPGATLAAEPSPDPLLSQAQIALALRAQAEGSISEDHFRKLTATAPDPAVTAPAAIHAPAAAENTAQLRAPDAAQIFRDPATAAQVSGQLAATVQRNGNGTYDVALNPPELGQVKITLQTHDKGIVVAINADRPETMDLIRRHVDQLARDFRELGYDKLSFSFGTNGGGTSRQDSAPASQTQFGPAEAAPEPAKSLAAPILPQRLAAGQIDIKF